tara:strand:- start:160 stop:753 length:594 start_codon:yes stop_codon:yes gene_type:complete
MNNNNNNDECFMIKLVFGSRTPKVDDLVRISRFYAGTYGPLMRVTYLDWDHFHEHDDVLDEGLHPGQFKRFIRSIELSDDNPTNPKKLSFNANAMMHAGKDEIRLCVETGPYYVNLYHIAQVYAGPEEGGWFYNEGHPHDCYRFDTHAEAIRFHMGPEIEKVLGDLNGDLPPHHYWYASQIEPFLPRHFPKRRPQYS